jgi:hypothetical protein
MERPRKLVGQDPIHQGDHASHSSGNDLSSILQYEKMADGNLEVLDMKANTFDPNLPGQSISKHLSATVNLIFV